jgi:hypothetical protein
MLSRGGFAVPEPEPVVMGAAYPWDATPREIAGLTRACEARGLGPPLSQGEFARLLLRTCWTDRAAFVAFHLPRECGRLAVHWARAATKPGRGGLVMTFATVPGEPWRRQALCENGEIQDPDFPRIVFLPIDGKRCRIWFKPVAGIPQWGGVFASLQPMAEALAGDELDTLQAACDAFGIECPPAAAGPTFDQALGELAAECRLYRALLGKHVRLCPDEPPTAYVSSGTYTRALLRQTGLRPLLDRFPDIPRRYLAATMGAYYAGDVFCRARGNSFPVRALDFGGAYGLSARLIGASGLLSAENLWIEDVGPAEAEAIIRRAVSEFERFLCGGPAPSLEAWSALAFLTVFVEPRGEVLPHRPRVGETWTAVRSALTYRKGPVPWQGSDIAVHLLDGGPMPRIVGASRLRWSGKVPMRPVVLPTGHTIDPELEDLVGALHDERERVEESLPRLDRRRLRGLLKGMTASLVSGLPMQVNDDEPTKTSRPVEVTDPRTGETATIGVHVLETPGDWLYPPLGAAVTATARLLLHTAIAMVHAAGGIVAYWDTDSVLVVAEQEPGLVPCPGGPERLPDGRAAVPALAYVELENIRARIDELIEVPRDTLPYVFSMAPDGNWEKVRRPRLLKLEPENIDGPSGFRTTLRAAPRASKKYVLYREEQVGPHVEIVDGEPVVVAPTQEQASRPHDLLVVRASAHGLPFETPDRDPRWRVSGYEQIIREERGVPSEFPEAWERPAIMQAPASKPEIVRRHPEARPFCRVGVAQLRLGGGQAIAPLHRRFRPGSADWRDAEGEAIRTEVGGVSLLRTLGEVQRRAWAAVDSRTEDTDGKAPIGATEGLIRSVPTVAATVRTIGKESRHLGIGRGVLFDPEFVEYGGDDVVPDVIEAARRLSRDTGARWRILDGAGVRDREFAYWLSGERRPGRESLPRLTAVVAAEARRVVRRSDAFGPLPRDDVSLIVAFLDLPEPDERCDWCGRALFGRQRAWCSEVCRKRASRARRQLRLWGDESSDASDSGRDPEDLPF